MVKVAVLGASGQIGQPLSLLLKSVRCLHPKNGRNFIILLILVLLEYISN